MKNRNAKFKTLKLQNKCVAFVDWANVYGWTKSLKKEVDEKKLFDYLKTYKEIKNINLYFGKDKHPKSINFIKNVYKIGFNVTTKPVKSILIARFENKKIYRRKCDFDMEICIDAHKAIKEKFNSFIFFTGDGDFEPLYKMLINLNKNVIVIYARNHLGREIYQINKGLYKIAINYLGNLYK
ncbi:MAG: hypothetical protein UR15_C0014G0013 [Parcubacteria group bacterium GW2011_GWA2_31_28]|nr:MAG: hypothetical protein UR15_C0014G0013 [Parcubacteria group bacterium GW2011_GWA2_31_28]